MTELLEFLYLYASSQRAYYTHEETQQNHILHNDLERIEDEISNLLTPEGQQRFEIYRQKRLQSQDIELECIFRAGLSIGLELSRL